MDGGFQLPRRTIILVAQSPKIPEKKRRLKSKKVCFLPYRKKEGNLILDNIRQLRTENFSKSTEGWENFAE